MTIRTRARSRRRGETAATSGSSLFGSTGWLFADLLLAIALVFLLATTVAQAPVPKHPRPHSSAARTTPTPTRTTGQPEPALDLTPVMITLTINVSDVKSGNAGAVAAIRRKVAGWPALKGRLAGLVLLFAGDDGSDPPAQWKGLDEAMWHVLTADPVFKVALHQDFETHGGSSATFQFDVYLFKTSLRVLLTSPGAPAEAAPGRGRWPVWKHRGRWRSASDGDGDGDDARGGILKSVVPDSGRHLYEHSRGGRSRDVVPTAALASRAGDPSLMPGGKRVK
jgi:hypothetical protein